MSNWIVSIINLWKPDRQVFKKGDRILGPHGYGTVVGGNLMIKYDDNVVLPCRHPYRQHPNNRTWTHNLEEFN